MLHSVRLVNYPGILYKQSQERNSRVRESYENFFSVPKRARRPKKKKKRKRAKEHRPRANRSGKNHMRARARTCACTCA